MNSNNNNIDMDELAEKIHDRQSEEESIREEIEAENKIIVAHNKKTPKMSAAQKKVADEKSIVAAKESTDRTIAKCLGYTYEGYLKFKENSKKPKKIIVKKVRKIDWKEMPLTRAIGGEKRFAGVCGGIARKYGLSPLVVRLIFAFGFLIDGIGGLIYIVLWVAMSKEKKE